MPSHYDNGNSASSENGNGGTSPSFWSRISDSVARGVDTLTDVYVQREIIDAFPESVSQSTRPTNLDYGVTEQPPQVVRGNASKISGVAGNGNGAMMGMNNQTLILLGVGIVGLILLTRS